MSKKACFNAQFKPGYVPNQPADESTRVNGNEPCGPTNKNKKMGSVVNKRIKKRGK